MNVSSTMVGVIRTALTFLEAIHAPVLEVSSWMRVSNCAMVYIYYYKGMAALVSM